MVVVVVIYIFNFVKEGYRVIYREWELGVFERLRFILDW